jgi:hypothetical protein
MTEPLSIDAKHGCCIAPQARHQQLLDITFCESRKALNIELGHRKTLRVARVDK